MYSFSSRDDTIVFDEPLYAHYLNKSIAFSYLDEKIINNNQKIQVEINGNFYNCEILKNPLYDPDGIKMRS